MSLTTSGPCVNTAPRRSSQTAVNPIVAMELIANGSWSGSGIFGPEAFAAEPFLDLLTGEYGSPWAQMEVAG